MKRILSRYGADVNFQRYFSIGLTAFTIVLSVHLLTCFYYLVGDSGAETLGNGVLVEGWVRMERNWWGPSDGDSNSTDVSGVESTLKPHPSISVSVRYTTSMYYVLNSLSRGSTTAERGFGIVCDFIRDVILGLVASVMTTITMSVSRRVLHLPLVRTHPLLPCV
jgi:hypothetical protein